MRVLLIAAVTADGFIGRDAHHLANWTSKEDKKLFVRITKEAGVVVMGAHTYKTIGRPLPGRRLIVYSSTLPSQPGVEVTQESPQQLLARLSAEGHHAVAICGGRTIYDMFLQAGVVDELYLTVEPVLFGQGISLLQTSAGIRLRLLDSQLLNDNVMLLHYGVQR